MPLAQEKKQVQSAFFNPAVQDCTASTAFRNYGNVCWWAPIPLAPAARPSECGSLLPLLKTLKIHVFHLVIESGSKLSPKSSPCKRQY
jgi:hypothetical protein